MATIEGYVDTHFHVYELERFQYDWPTPGMKIYKNYFPCGLESGVEGTPVKHGVFVQCLNGSPEEAEWVMDMATRHPIIKGVVAGLDLTSSQLEDTIKRLLPSGLLKGVRHILDVEKDDWITRDDVTTGMRVLEKYNLTYDILVRPCHLKHVPAVVSKHPNLKFIINHIAKPPFEEGKLEGWAEDMAAIAKFPNVHCKITGVDILLEHFQQKSPLTISSGLISELNPATWKSVNHQPFIDHVLSIFTPDRCIFGSDWPVFELVEASYAENFNVTSKLLSSLNDSDKRKVFRENAIKFYNLTLDK